MHLLFFVFFAVPTVQFSKSVKYHCSANSVRILNFYFITPSLAGLIVVLFFLRRDVGSNIFLKKENDVFF